MLVSESVVGWPPEDFWRLGQCLEQILDMVALETPVWDEIWWPERQGLRRERIWCSAGVNNLASMMSLCHRTLNNSKQIITTCKLVSVWKSANVDFLNILPSTLEIGTWKPILRGPKGVGIWLQLMCCATHYCPIPNFRDWRLDFAHLVTL